MNASIKFKFPEKEFPKVQKRKLIQEYKEISIIPIKRIIKTNFQINYFFKNFIIFFSE